MTYQNAIREIDPSVDAAAVEAWMRLQYHTLSHLPHETFVYEVALYKAARMTFDQARRLKRSFGM
jgi:hypothetical protein